MSLERLGEEEMNCPTATGKYGIVIDYCARGGEARASELFKLHLADCQDCGKVVAAQRAAWAALDSFDGVAVSADFDRRLYARIQAEEAGRSAFAKWLRSWTARWSPFNWRPMVPAAAMGAAIVAALMLQPSLQTPSVRPLAPPVELQAQAQSIDADQVERALDDLDMLKQLGASSGEKSGSI